MNAIFTPIGVLAGLAAGPNSAYRSTALSPTAASITTKIQRTIRYRRMLTTLCRFFADSLRRSSRGLLTSSLLSRSTVRGMAKLGEPSNPVFARTCASSGIMTLVASRQLSPVRPPVG